MEIPAVYPGVCTGCACVCGCGCAGAVCCTGVAVVRLMPSPLFTGACGAAPNGVNGVAFGAELSRPVAITVIVQES